MMEQPTRVEITLATLLRALALIVVVWLWFRLWPWVLVLMIGVFLAVALDPVVRRLERYHLRPAYAAPLLMLLLIGALSAFFYAAGASLAEQARLLGDRLGEARSGMMDALPPELRQSVSGLGGSGGSGGEWLQRAGQALTDGILYLAVALVVAVYLLIDGRRTYEWLAAFAPPRLRPRVDATAEGAREVIAAYVRGNVVTSAICAVATWVFLAALKVPAALLLALLAGILDFVPVIGIFLSAAPAILLGLTVSSGVGVAVAVFYAAYNVVENYWLQPRVYGRMLRLSDLAVITAFLVGAELGGVLGALVALPLVAMYPVVERVWSKGARRRVADEHQRIEAQPED